MTSSVQIQSSEIIARKENFSEIDHQSAFYSYFNRASAMQLFAPQLFAHQTLMNSWPFQPTFFSGWPLSTPLPFTSPPSEETKIINNNYLSSAQHETVDQSGDEYKRFSTYASSYTRSISPASPFNDSTESKKHHKDSKKVFECKICHKTFGYKHVLQNHEKVHTGEKNYRCLKCNKCFRRDHHLKVHMRLHSGEKPYVCTYPLCERQFVQVANLRRHLKTHEHAVTNLKIHEKLLAANDSRSSSSTYTMSETSSEEALKLRDNVDVECTPLDMSCKVRYDSPEQSEPEDLSKKSLPLTKSWIMVLCDKKNSLYLSLRYLVIRKMIYLFIILSIKSLIVDKYCLSLIAFGQQYRFGA